MSKIFSMKKFALLNLILIILFYSCSQPTNNPWVDLTHTYDSNSLCWPIDSESHFQHILEYWGTTSSKDVSLEKNEDKNLPVSESHFYSSFKIKLPEHCGTHLDAPIHFSEAKWTVDQIPLTSLIGTAYIIDVSAKCKDDRDYQVSIDDVKDFEENFSEIPEQSIIIFKTGYAKFYPNKKLSFGTDSKGRNAISLFHFPGVSPALAEWIVKAKKAKLVGIDTPSLDYGQSTAFETHQIFLGNLIPQIENVGDLDVLKSKKVNFIALPMKIGTGSGAPVRVIAQDL